MSERGDDLLVQVASGGDGYAVNELLSEFFRGYPIDRLRELLRSDDPEAVKSGIWLAAELTKQAIPLLGDIRPLIEHSDRYVRYHAIEVMFWADAPEHGPAIAEAISHVRDSDGVVRAKAIEFLARATAQQLELASPYLPPDLSTLIRDLLAGGEPHHPCAGTGTGTDAAADAFRLARFARAGHYAPLIEALNSPDEGLRVFAEDELRFRDVKPGSSRG